MIKRCPHFHVHHSVYTIANLWKQSMCLLTDEWIKRLHTHTHTHTHTHWHAQWNITQPWDAKNPDICNNMDGS